jgi:hypothetical protein
MSTQATPSTSGSSARGPTTNSADVLARQANQIQELQQAMDAMQQNMVAAQEAFTIQGNELVAAKEGLNAAKRQSQAKIALPKKFSGKKEDLNPFLAAMELYHRYNANTFDKEEDKILSAMMTMEGDALAWAEPFMSDWLEHGGNKKKTRDGTDEVFESWAKYKERIRATFGEVDAEKTAQRKLLALRQTSSASQFAADFQRLSARLGWDDAALAGIFYAGLKDAVKDNMTFGERPDELESMIELAVRIDNRIHERAVEKRTKGYLGIPRRQDNGRSRNQMFEGEPMDLDKVGRNPRKKEEKKKPWNPPQKQPENKKKQEWKKAGACLGCGKQGHFIRDCSEKKVSVIKRPQDCKNPGNHWSTCTEGGCLTHYDGKMQSGYWPTGKKVGAIIKEVPAYTENLTKEEINRRLKDRKCWICAAAHPTFLCPHPHYEVPFTKERFREVQSTLELAAKHAGKIEFEEIWEYVQEIFQGHPMGPRGLRKNQEPYRPICGFRWDHCVDDGCLWHRRQKQDNDYWPCEETVRPDTPLPRIVITQEEWSKRQDKGDCLICGSIGHLRETCRWKEHPIFVPGQKQIVKDESAEWTEDEEEEPLASDHTQWHWMECTTGCKFHRDERKKAGWLSQARGHEGLTVKQCFVGWSCKHHGATMKAEHEKMDWEQCSMQYCPIHMADKRENTPSPLTPKKSKN